jgi:hypothetical protein
VVVTNISLLGWSVSAFDSAPLLTIGLAAAGVLLLILGFLVIVVIAGIALDAARRANRQR